MLDVAEKLKVAQVIAVRAPATTSWNWLVRGRQHIGDGRRKRIIGYLGHLDVARRGQCADHLKLAGELFDLLDAKFDAQPVTEGFGFLGVGARHNDDRLGGGEPQVRGAHYDQRRAGAAFLVEGVQVRVTPPAGLWQLVAPDRTLCLGHPTRGAAGRASDHRPHALAQLRAAPAPVHPQFVREFVEAAVGAGEQLLGGHGAPSVRF